MVVGWNLQIGTLWSIRNYVRICLHLCPRGFAFLYKIGIWLFVIYAIFRADKRLIFMSFFKSKTISYKSQNVCPSILLRIHHFRPLISNSLFREL